MPVAREFYLDNLKQFQELADKEKRHSFIIAIARLIVFICVVFLVYYFIRTSMDLLAWFTVGAIILFFQLVRKAANISNRIGYFEALVKINRNELGISDHEASFFNNGQQFLHFESHLFELDVFGDNSLFHLINRSTTSHGRDRLAMRFSNPAIDPEFIRKNQEAVRQLSNQPNHVQDIIANGLIGGESEGNLNSLYDWMKQPVVVTKKTWVQIVRFLLPAIALSSFIYYLSTDNYIPMLVAVILSWMVTGLFSRYIHEQHNQLSKKQVILEQYAGILKSFTGIDGGKSILLQNLKDQSTDAHSQLYKLSSLSRLFDQRMNLLVNIFLNSFLMYDIHCVIALENWKLRNHSFNQWIDAVSEIESLVSLSVFAYNNPGYCYPHIHMQHPLLEAEGMGHPLIEEDELIRNSYKPLTEKVVLITGSNMSGKTTFLRSLGVNLLLAQAGSPVCATAFRIQPMQLLTSIRINDSLQEHTSYFLAELKRLQYIIGQLKSGLPSLILIDEILRGTNSDDKTFGSAGFIKKLLPSDCLAFFATHDLALSELEQEHPGEVSNYCFESTIQNDELNFDYTLRSGVAQNKNASFLMKKMGIIGNKA